MQEYYLITTSGTLPDLPLRWFANTSLSTSAHVRCSAHHFAGGAVINFVGQFPFKQLDLRQPRQEEVQPMIKLILINEANPPSRVHSGEIVAQIPQGSRGISSG